MKRNEFLKQVETSFQMCKNILEGKGKEYSGDEDVHANFKRLADGLHLLPEEVVLTYMQKHIDSVFSFVRSIKRNTIDGMKNPISTAIKGLSEPFDGRIHDVINYCLLLQTLIGDRMSVEPFNYIRAKGPSVDGVPEDL